MRNAGLEEAQAEIKIARRNANSLRYADGTSLMAESTQQADQAPRGGLSRGLKLNLQKTKIMASKEKAILNVCLALGRGEGWLCIC